MPSMDAADDDLAEMYRCASAPKAAFACRAVARSCSGVPEAG